MGGVSAVAALFIRMPRVWSGWYSLDGGIPEDTSYSQELDIGMVGCEEDGKGILVHMCQLTSSEIRQTILVQAEKGVRPTSWPGSQSSHTGTWEEAMVTILNQG